MPKAIGLTSSVKRVLQSILGDYPGGQLLSEALQNAEGSGATNFALMLDLRGHSPDTVDVRLGAPAFVLVDDGRGLGELEWASLRNLQDKDSAKRESPSEIGRYGMGRRSYFHYSDLTIVKSRGLYVGLDPLYRVHSHGREGTPGWEQKLPREETLLPAEMAAGDTAFSAEDIAVQKEAHVLLSPFESMCGEFPQKGAMFRLPLRRNDEYEEDGLGPAISLEKAKRMLRDWTSSLLDSRLLLFLASVCGIKIWRWEKDAAEPELVAQVNKTFADGQSCPRLPPELPSEARESFGKLEEHLSCRAFRQREGGAIRK